jgi:hypothetical protein
MKVNNNDDLTKSLKEIKRRNYNKKSSIPKINNLKISSSSLKPNKTIQKYINERLNSIKKSKNNYKENNSIYDAIKSKIKINVKPNKNKLIISHKKKNNNKYIEVIKKKEKTDNFLIDKVKDNSNVDNSLNKSFNIIFKRKENSKESKLINSFSTSAGISFCSNENKKNMNYIENKINENNYYYNINKYNVDSFSNKKCIYNYLNDYNIKKFLEESNCNQNNKKNINYENGNDDNEYKIFFKFDDNSLLTFGNSFSYSNSQRNILKNDDKISNKRSSCKDFLSSYNINNNIYVNKLKEENETLKKELKESNHQINILINQIKELKECKNDKNRKLKNKICSPNIWNNKNLRFSFFENKKECNNIKIGLNEKKKFNKEILKDINNIINDKYYFKNGKKKILIKRKFLCEKNSEIINGKYIDNINECISKLQI